MKEKTKVGRKGKYDSDTMPLIAEQCARDGMIDSQIWGVLGIAKNTYYKFQREHPEFKEAIARGKKPVNIMVENMLLKRAMGYDVEETHKDLKFDAEGKPIPSAIRTVKRHIPPDQRAIESWLYNRDPERWRKTTHQTHEFVEQPLFPEPNVSKDNSDK